MNKETMNDLILKQHYVAKLRRKRLLNDKHHNGVNWYELIFTDEHLGVRAEIKIGKYCFIITVAFFLGYVSEVFGFLPQASQFLQYKPMVVVVIFAFIALQDKAIKYGYLLRFDVKAHYLNEVRFWKAGLYFLINLASSSALIGAVVLSYVDKNYIVVSGHMDWLDALIMTLVLCVPMIIDVVIVIGAIKWANKNDAEIINY